MIPLDITPVKLSDGSGAIANATHVMTQQAQLRQQGQLEREHMALQAQKMEEDASMDRARLQAQQQEWGAQHGFEQQQLGAQQQRWQTEQEKVRQHELDGLMGKYAAAHAVGDQTAIWAAKQELARKGYTVVDSDTTPTAKGPPTALSGQPVPGGQPPAPPQKPWEKQATAGLRQLEGMAARPPATAGMDTTGRGDPLVDAAARTTATGTVPIPKPSPPKVAPPTSPVAVQPPVPSAPAQPAGGKVSRVKTADGRVIGEFDHNQIMAEHADSVNRTFQPLMTGQYPKIAKQAMDVTIARLGTMPAPEAIKEGIAFYTAQTGQLARSKGKGGSGVGGAVAGGLTSKTDFDRGMRLNAQTLAAVKEMRVDEQYVTTVKNGEAASAGLRALGANNGFGDTLSIKQIVHALNGANSSDKEFNQIYGGMGRWLQLEADLNKFTDEAKLPDALKNAVKEYFSANMEHANRKRVQAINSVRAVAEAGVLRAGGTAEEAKAYGDYAQIYFSGKPMSDANIPDKGGGKGVTTPRQAPAGQQPAASPPQDPKQASLDRAKAALEGVD